MSPKSYTLTSDEKATPVMVGTSHTLIWGDLITKVHVNIPAFLNTLAEDFVALHDAKILFLAHMQQQPPIDRPQAYVKLEEILLFFTMTDIGEVPEETEVRRYEPMEVIVGSFYVKGVILKSPIATIQNMLLVSKEDYMPIYKAKVRHVAKPWLGTFTSNMVQFRRDRLILSLEEVMPVESSGLGGPEGATSF
jgi:hypothetical protein